MPAEKSLHEHVQEYFKKYCHYTVIIIIFVVFSLFLYLFKITNLNGSLIPIAKYTSFYILYIFIFLWRDSLSFVFLLSAFPSTLHGFGGMGCVLLSYIAWLRSAC